ncbi:MAG: branched-chain amino acid ABC transporter permease [Deltaproteobacteria bacterium]|nr:branched-chain amino acid ABC transporter permease [Deltaproteobacteria bacterium]
MIQVFISGLFLGGVYALLAVGLSLAFGIMGVLNLAHGSLAVLGAILYKKSLILHPFSPWVFSVLAAPIFLGLGFILHLIIVTPFRNLSLSASVVASLIASLGVAFILEDLFVWWQGGLSALFLKKTDRGRSMRALAQDKEAASLYGIHPAITSMNALGLATIMAGLAGIFYSVLYPLGPRDGLDLTLKALFIVVAGGMGNLRGPAVAGLLLGLLESFAGFLFTSTSTDTIVYSLLVIYLVLKRGRRRQ